MEDPDEIEDVGEAAPEGDSREAPDTGFPDIRSAAEAAMKLTREDDETPDSDEAGQSATDAPAGTASPDPAAAVTQRLFSEQAAIDRALSLHRQGRTHELPPEVQGQIRKWEGEVLERAAADKAEDDAFLEVFVSNLALRESDPDEYLKLLDDPELGDDTRLFMREFAKAHPEVTLDNPQYTPRAKTPDELRVEFGNEIAERLNTSLRALAEEKGITNFDDIREKSRGNATLLTAVIDAGIEVGVAKKLDGIRKAERDAAVKEAMAAYGGRMPSLPISGNARAPQKQRPRDFGSIREAAEYASTMEN